MSQTTVVPILGRGAGTLPFRVTMVTSLQEAMYTVMSVVQIYRTVYRGYVSNCVYLYYRHDHVVRTCMRAYVHAGVVWCGLCVR